VNTVRSLHVLWSVSTNALRRSVMAGRTAGGAGLEAGQLPAFTTSDASVDLSLELGLDADGADTRGPTGVVKAVLSPPGGVALEFAQNLTLGAFGRWETDATENLLHVTLGEPTSDTPLLVATLRLCESGTVSVLYARTTLLAYLGLPGGRYEVAGATLSEPTMCGANR